MKDPKVQATMVLLLVDRSHIQGCIHLRSSQSLNRRSILLPAEIGYKCFTGLFEGFLFHAFDFLPLLWLSAVCSKLMEMRQRAVDLK